MSSDDLYVDSERTRNLITAINSSADTLKTVRADEQALTIASAFPGTGIEGACLTGSQDATAAIGSITEKVRVVSANTDSGLKALEDQDRLNGTHITSAGR